MAAAWVINTLHREAEFRPWRYDDPPLSPQEAASRDVIIADFSFRRPALEAINAAAQSLRVMDHHKTAQADLAGLPYCVFDMSRSGAGLTWDLLRGEEDRPWLIDYVEDRDLWKHALPQSREIGAAIYELPFGVVGEVLDFAPWYEMANSSPKAAATRGAYHLQTSARLTKQIADNAQLCTLDGHTCWVASAPVLFSEVAGMLAERDDLQLGVVTYQRADGRWVYSLRSRDGFDCSEIAKKFRGGGHAQAAGFVVDSPVHYSLPHPK